MSIAQVAGVRPLEWDSAFWGFPMGEAEWPEVFPGERSFLQMLLSAGEPVDLARAVGRGFKPVDVRVTLDRPPNGSVLQAAGSRFYEETDLSHLVRIARESHRITRYYADPGFPNDRCDDLYETWIRNSVDGWADRVLVTGAPARGYATVHLDGATASIGLIAVDEQARGQGAGFRLVHGALRWAHSAGATRMTVVTQGRNIAAQRLFQRCGFRTCDTQVWMHKWTR